MPTEPRVGDQVIFQGKLFWLAVIINMGTGQVVYALRQAHWGKHWHILVNRSEVLLDTPPVA